MSSSLIEKSERPGDHNAVIAEPPDILLTQYPELPAGGWFRLSWAECKACGQRPWTHRGNRMILACVRHDGTVHRIGETGEQNTLLFKDLRVVTTH